MSGPKTTQYELEQQRRRRLEEERRRKIEEEARKKREREERERREREKREKREREERQKREKRERRERERIDAEIQKMNKEMRQSEQALDSVMASISKVIAEEEQRQKERKREEQNVQNNTTVPSAVKAEDIPRSLDFEEVLKAVKKQVPAVKEYHEDLDEIVKELIQEPVEIRSLLDDYVSAEPQKQEVVQDLETKQFEELLFTMEEEYKEIVNDRAFFKQEKQRIVAFEETCKRMQEYRSYKILRDVYYGELTKLKKEREKWHELYEQWKAPFQESYAKYRTICEMMNRTPKFYYLNVNTVQQDIEQMKTEYEILEKEYMQIQEQLEVAKAFDEVMEEMGYHVLGKKTITKKSGGTVENKVFSYGDGTGIHVMDSGQRITMEVVGIEDESRAADEIEREYLKKEQEFFCESFVEIEKELKKRGVVLKNRLRMLPPSEDYAMVMDMKDYIVTEHKSKAKNLSKVDKKGKRKQSGKKYLHE